MRGISKTRSAKFTRNFYLGRAINLQTFQSGRPIFVGYFLVIYRVDIAQNGPQSS